MEHTFPEEVDILSRFSSEINTLWSNTLSACNESTCREYGARFYIDTREGAVSQYDYESITGDDYPSSLSSGAHIDFGSIPNDIKPSHPCHGGRFLIGLFHTHPPRTYVPTNIQGTNVSVGPSNGDNAPSYNIPAIVMDYVSTTVDDEENIAVPPGHPADSLTMYYSYGGNKRDILTR